jgi:glycosyltransferase involved in cell wall biosynthesis
MPKVLIVSPRFPPTNAADLHRVRVSVGYYRSFGWEPTILCVDPATADCIDDPELAQSLPEDLPVVRVRAWSELKCRRFGFGQLSYRSLLPLYLAGSRLLRRERRGVVFFSTTVFLCFALGRLWKWRYGCSLVYDFHDPWYREPPLFTRATVPGRWWKYRLDQWLARHLEKFALRGADHIVSVSDGYVRTLSQRYRTLDPTKFTVLPFAASADDYRFVEARKIEQTVFQPDGRSVHWVYAGAIAPGMTSIVSVLFAAVAGLLKQEPGFAAHLRLDFVGTDYASAGRAERRVEPLAREHGLEDAVAETPERLPYFETISLYRTCDAILLIGSVDSDYVPSKLFTCVLSRKPILALLHRRSPTSGIAAQMPNVFLATFDETPAEPAFRAQVMQGLAWLRAPSFDPAAIDMALEPWSAEELTRRQCAIFDRVSMSPALPARLSKAPLHPLR